MKQPISDPPIDVSISNFEDVILARQKVRELMQSMQFSLLDQTRVVTAVSELARNIVVHAKRGTMSARVMTENQKSGIRCIFEDQGPGIPDIDRAMQSGFSTSNSLGLGLSGARNLCSEFRIASTPGKGTTVTITEWKKKRI